LDCYYNTEGQDSFIYGGQSSADEMCISFVFVYPAPNLYQCINEIPDETVSDWAEVAVNEGYLSIPDGVLEYIINANLVPPGTELWDIGPESWSDAFVYWNNTNGDGQNVYNKLWDDEEYGTRYSYCSDTDNNAIRFDNTSYQNDIEPFEEYVPIRGDCDTTTTTTTTEEPETSDSMDSTMMSTIMDSMDSTTTENIENPDYATQKTWSIAMIISFVMYQLV